MPPRLLNQPPLMPGGSIGGLRVVNPVDRGRELRQEEAIKTGFSVGEYKTKKDIDLKLRQQEPLSQEAAKTFQLAVDGVMNIEGIRDKVKQGSKFFMPSVTDRDLDSMRSDLSDLIGRLRSGGAINDDEGERFLGLIPGVLDSKAVKINKLNRLEAKFRNIGLQMSSKDRFESSLEDSRKIINPPQQNYSNNAATKATPFYSPKPKTDFSKMSDEEILKLLK